MEIAYWIVAGLLAVFFLYAGGKKILQNTGLNVTLIVLAAVTVWLATIW